MKRSVQGLDKFDARPQVNDWALEIVAESVLNRSHVSGAAVARGRRRRGDNARQWGHLGPALEILTCNGPKAGGSPLFLDLPNALFSGSAPTRL